ncbi:MAG: glycoside hydrolase family 28 protein [Candidatus Hydrogenedentes bacterium]|nr:glycoside hydrolase family 28 protein [Candidatus Hydrogenedentota bacterium]
MAVAAGHSVYAASARPFYNVMDYGAVPDGKTLCTKSIQKAIDECAKAGGGRVIVPGGKFLTGPIFLKSNINLEITAGATLLGSTNFDDYPVIDGRWEGIERKVYASLITGIDLENVSITGRGTLDGQGKVWWEAKAKTKEIRKKHGITEREPENPPESPLKWPRARTINLYRCKNILISGIKLTNSPAWTIHPVYCENLTVDGVSIFQPDDSPNTDGINPDSCKNVRISNCYLDCGDDCITLKSGYNEDGRRVGIPCENISITNCTMAHGHGGVVVGSEMSGDVRNVTISNCVFDGTQRGLRIKSTRGRGGVVENIRASNIVMRDNDTAFSITTYYGGALTTKPEVNEGTPVFRNFHWSDIIVTGSKQLATIEGLPEMPLEDISLSNIMVVSTEKGIECSTVDGIVFDNIRVSPDKGPALTVKDSSNIEIYRFTNPKPDKDVPVIVFENVDTALVQSCTAAKGTGTFLEKKGGANKDITMTNNRLSKAVKGIEEK